MQDIWERPLLGAWVAPARRWTAVTASALFLASVGVFAAVSHVSLRSDGTQQVIVGPWNGDTLLVSSLVASVVLLAVIVVAVPARRWWLLLFVPLRVLTIVAALLGSAALAVSDESVSPIVANGCETGYVVSERAFLRSSSGEVLRLEGIIGTHIAWTSVDDGHKPFQQRSYIAVADADVMRVWHTFENVAERLSRTSEPAFVLPRLTFDTGCGLAEGRPVTATPLPRQPGRDEGPLMLPTEVAPADARAQIARMAELTIASAVGTAVDATGTPVRAPEASELPCEGTTGVELVFATDDNTASYDAILAAWTAAGYASDRAMQEDIRFDGAVRLSARDRSTIDGMLHFQLGAQCRAS